MTSRRRARRQVFGDPVQSRSLRVLIEDAVEPVVDPGVAQRPRHRFAMAAGALGRGEAHELLDHDRTPPNLRRSPVCPNLLNPCSSGKHPHPAPTSPRPAQPSLATPACSPANIVRFASLGLIAETPPGWPAAMTTGPGGPHGPAGAREHAPSPYQRRGRRARRSVGLPIVAVRRLVRLRACGRGSDQRE